MMVTEVFFKRMLFALAFGLASTSIFTSCDSPLNPSAISVTIAEDRDLAENLLLEVMNQVGQEGIVNEMDQMQKSELLARIQMSIQNAGDQLNVETQSTVALDIPLQSGKNARVSIAYDFQIEEQGNPISLRDSEFQKAIVTQKERLLKGDNTASSYFQNLRLTQLEQLNNETIKFQGPVVLNATIHTKNASKTISYQNSIGVVYVGRH